MKRNVPHPKTVVMDLDAENWKAIKEAAGKSPWIPKEYFMNDWVSDVCAFLLTRERAKKRPGRDGAWEALYAIHMLMADWSVPITILENDQYTVRRVKELLIHYQRASRVATRQGGETPTF